MGVFPASLPGAILALAAATAPTAMLPVPATRAAAEASVPRIGRITVDVVEVFDQRLAGENRLFHRVVNTLHVRTQPKVVYRELLFAEGDPLDEDLLAETERNLRGLKFLRDAQITTSPGGPGLVDVHVQVKDSWTTRAGYSLGRAGGNNSGTLSVKERNLLGLGKELAFKFSSDQDRSTNTFSYLDGRLFGSRLRLWYERKASSDGNGDFFSLERPFFSLASRWTGGVRGSRRTEILPVYSRGEKIAEFDNAVDSARVFYGFSRRRGGGTVHRYTFAWTYNSTRNTPESVPDVFPAEQVPIDRTVSAPLFIFRRETSDWVETSNLARMARSEDHNLGTVLEIETALNTRSFGGTGDELLIDALVTWGIRTSESGMLFFRTDLDSRYGEGATGQSLVTFQATYYDTRFSHQTLVGHVELDYGSGLDSSDRLLLGGDEGLRGFDSRILDGDRRFLITIEDRIWTGRELLRLAHVGAAVFADVGNAWGGPGSNGFGLLHSNVGFGLRFDASRASEGGLLRLDVAFPVSGDRRGGPGIQLSFGRGASY